MARVLLQVVTDHSKATKKSSSLFVHHQLSCHIYKELLPYSLGNIRFLSKIKAFHPAI